MTLYKEPHFSAIFVDNAVNLRQFDKDMVTVLGAHASNLKAILDHGISLTDNIDNAFISFTSAGAANDENAVNHSLGKVPTGFVVYDLDKGGVVYRGTTTWTKTQIFLKVSLAGVAVKAWIF